MGGGGLLGGMPPAGSSVLSPGSGKVAQGKREKVWLPFESTQHLFPHSRRGKHSEQVHKREERAGCILPSFSILCLPFSLCRAGLSPPSPYLLPALSASLSCFL